MRLLIQSSNRWTVELTSTKHHTVDCSTPHRGPIFASPTSETNSIARSSDRKTPIISSTATPTTEVQKVETDQHPALSRRKSIRKRLGRIFLHFTRANPALSYETYEYRYSGGASELPVGEAPIEGSATVEEMPASFATAPYTHGETFELEQPQPHTSINQFYAMNSSNDETLLDSRQSFCKQDYADELAIYRAPLQIATPKSLPRLAVPASMHDIPAMTHNQSPISASSISPNTPVGHSNNGAQQYWSSRSGPPLVSPCDATSTLPWYRPQRQQYHTQRSFQSPLTPSSAGSFNGTTPLTSYPSSAYASFGAWPQPEPEYLRSAFPQRYRPINHESKTHLAPGVQPNTLAADVDSHQCCRYGSRVDIQNQATSSEKNMHPGRRYVPHDYDLQLMTDKSAYSESRLLPAMYNHDATTHVCRSTEEVPLPPYSLMATNPPQYAPATCEHCGKIFTGKYGKGNLTRHIRQIHESLLGGAVHLCRICMKTYNRADALRKHSWKKHRDEESRPNKRRRS